MAVCESGPMFLKAINCEGEYKDKFFLSNLLVESIREIGPENVVQVITDNASVCKAAGILVEAKFRHIFWTPCVVHTLNLALKNICSPSAHPKNVEATEQCGWIARVSGDAWFIKNFIMNHSMRLSMFNFHCKLKLLSIADTRFASTIIMLKRFKQVKQGLEHMVLSESWDLYKEDDVNKAKLVKEKVLDEYFWADLNDVLIITAPIYDMLRLADTDSPCLHLVYEWWDSMIEKVKVSIYKRERRQNHEESKFFNVVYGILVERWTKSSTPLHCLAHSLNPRDFISKAAGSKLVEESVKLVYGEDSHVIKDGRIAGIQAISGTGACRLFAEFQRHFHPESKLYLPDPTWSNHHNIWRNAGVPLRTFHYYDHDSKNLDFAALVDDVKNAPDKSFFLLHPCAHNPTGVDPTEEQWREISYLFKVKRHFPFFDMAYQGFASGDLDKDAQAIRIFLEDGHLLGCAHTFTKNMGLYGNQAGCLSVICTDSEQALAVKSQLQNIARAMYSRPSIHGVLLISTILSDPVLKALWVEDVKLMANRIQSIRASLRECLENLGSHLSWEHITDQVGMFCFSGLTPEQVDQLIRKFHIYMTSDGRINIAGVTTKNMSYLANAIHEVTRDQEDSSETLYAANYSS